ncbi:MAG: hypothetical protein VB144_01145 [Clostridia bacterium]|nr:hypothetical protein [Clostridia bacterium]
MRVPTDPESVGLMRALRPFLSSRGQAAVDDLLGSVNLITIFDSLGGVMKKRRGVGGDRPLAFLSNLANMELDPKTVAKAVDNMFDFTGAPTDDLGKAKGNQGQHQGAPRPEDVTKLLQSMMARAAADPNFAAMLGSLAEEGMRSNILPKLADVLGAEAPPEDNKCDQ